MVAILTIERLDMQSHAEIDGERLEKFAHEIGVEIADLLPREYGAEDEKGPAGEIDRNASQRLVHRQQHIGEASDAAHVAERLPQRLAERDAGVFDGVMRIDMQIALAGNLHVDQRMPRELLKHVIEKADAGCNLRAAAAIEVDAD